jgi:hypothetical protein
MVRFKNYIYVSEFTEKKYYNYIDGRSSKERKNRLLSKIEEYMKKHNLLFKNEYLEFSKIETKHIRISYIQCICIDKEWIYPDEFLKIVF